MFRIIIHLVLGIVTLSAATSPASAAFVTAVPNSWLLQSYQNEGVVVWGTPSTCTSGNMMFPASAAQKDHDRFFAMIMTAKATNMEVRVYYDMVNGYCYISSFGLMPN